MHHFPKGLIKRHEIRLYSVDLNREVIIDVYVPHVLISGGEHLPVLFVNDGQDVRRWPIKKQLRRLFLAKNSRPIIVVAIHAGPKRNLEYGTIHHLEVNRHGLFALEYSRFIIDQLIPYISTHYRVSEERYFAGFSLGGLSAFDLVLNHGSLFRGVGVFSGSFWWRDQKMNPQQPDANLIVPRIIQETTLPKPLKCWFQVGSLDEQSDRNRNGIIDSIDDTRLVIKELIKNGHPAASIAYVEMVGGRHHVPTWARAFPWFLEWVTN